MTEEGDEEQELRLAPGVDDRALVDAADASDGREERTAYSGHQHDLADVPPLVDEAVRVGGPVEGEGLGDDGLELAGEASSERLDERGRGRPRGPTS